MREIEMIQSRCRTSQRRVALTLIELLVVIGILAMVTAFMLVATSAVRQSAKIVETTGTIKSLQDGLEIQRKSLGQGYAPSKTDDPRYNGMYAAALGACIDSCEDPGQEELYLPRQNRRIPLGVFQVDLAFAHPFQVSMAPSSSALGADCSA